MSLRLHYEQKKCSSLNFLSGGRRSSKACSSAIFYEKETDQLRIHKIKTNFFTTLLYHFLIVL